MSEVIVCDYGSIVKVFVPLRVIYSVMLGCIMYECEYILVLLGGLLQE